MIVQLSNPRGLNVPGLEGLFRQALAKSNLPSFDVARDEYAKLITNDRVGVLIGVEEGLFKALCIILLPVNPFDTTPQVAHFYNSGSPSLRRSLIQAVVDFISQAGYNRFWGLNLTGKSDRAWTKVMQPAGWTITPKGTLMEFNQNGCC